MIVCFEMEHGKMQSATALCSRSMARDTLYK